jgi:pimeloyl-ACP methyl ester carboxylesterase
MPVFNILGLPLDVLSIAPVPSGASGPTLVFLHEGLGSIGLWRDWPAQLCQQLQLPGLVYSRQGYGHSAPVADVRGEPRITHGLRQGRLQPDYMHHEALTVLPALLQELGIHQPILVGHSDGGTIALLHASQHPVTACVVMAPHVRVEDISVQAITQARQAFTKGGLRARLAKFHADVDGAFWQWNEVWLSAGFRSFDIRREIEAITAPLLAIQGEDDAYGTLAQIDDIARHVPHAQLLKLAQCGHSPHKDQALAVNAAIARFVAGLSSLGG